MSLKKTVMLCILDGVGLAPDGPGNAVTRANTPFLDKLFETCPRSELRTDGPFVGLPVGQMGNSEVGHLTIGSGRVLKQSLERINEDIAAGSFATRPEIRAFMQKCPHARAIHIVGLISDGGVHSHGDHAIALCHTLNTLGKPVFLHAITDGRDTDAQGGLDYFERFMATIAPLQNVHLASIIGRFYAMDRDKRWERVLPAWNLLTQAHGTTFAGFKAAFTDAYDQSLSDEFIPASVLPVPTGLDPRLQDGDAVFLFNFRADRMRQITSMLIGQAMDGVAYTPIKTCALTSMTSYDDAFDLDVDAVYTAKDLTNTIGEIVAKSGMTQLRAAETEKYPHVTYYLGGGRETPFPGEDRLMIASPKEVTSYDEKPEMSLPLLTDKVVAAIESGAHDFIALNIANGDMVGHCGNMAAAMAAMEAVDAALSRIIPALQAAGGQAIIIADHGNIEEMIRDGKPCTTHSTNPVPCVYVGPRPVHLRNGSLADVAPTLLTLLNLPIAAEMSGQSLL
ncbi:MAG: 2,3-bisphosphoglycerate-independent phosphoglycerate mutase [Pseudomonadota bacterium]